MLRRLIEASVRHAMLVLLLAVAVLGGGGYALTQTPLDALPDLSAVQVIVDTPAPGQAPQGVEDQVTYPLTSALLSVPQARVVRGFSMFGVSYVYLIFEDGTDIYWARSRVLEYLNAAQSGLPAGVTPRLGPDATGVGWVFQYALQGRDQSLADLRSLQDWYVRYALLQAQGVAEVAGVGGQVREYQVTVDPHQLASVGVSLEQVLAVIRSSNQDVGGRTIELAEKEFMVRGLGYLRSMEDIGQLVLKSEGGTPILIRDVAHIEEVPAERRGIAELNGEGEVASGIVMARFGENALAVIEQIKTAMAELAPGLPDGVTLEAVYDRSELIYDAIDNLQRTVLEECLIVALVCLVFLLHARSALVAVITLPLGVLIAFIVMRWLDVGSNIMSLGGIAIAIGAMVDSSIVMIENAHKRLEHLPPEASTQARRAAMLAACQEVGPALFFSLMIITVSFLPVFALEGQEGRLFTPLALTKTFAMAGAALLSVTLVPVLMMYLVRGRILPERRNPISRLLIWLYRPLIRGVLRFKGLTLLAALGMLAATWIPLRELGSEFMPTLNEGTLFYMPASLPGMSVTEAARLLQTTNRIIKTFPEVASVYGKAGRADTATDPAPLEMFETVINLKPASEWRPGVTVDSLIAEMDAALQFPGVANAWTMPIKARIDMLSTGIRTPVGVKLFGRDLTELERLAREVETTLKDVPGTSSAYAERITGGYYLDIAPRRDELARHGISVGDFQRVISTALGGEPVTTLVQGRERYNLSVRYPRALRDDPQKMASEVYLEGVFGPVPLGALATLSLRSGAPAIRTENAMLVAYVYVDVRDRDIGSYVEDARKAVDQAVRFPPGYHASWSGQYEYMERAKARLQILVPVTLGLIFLLLYMN
ncbi:MAG: CusA/CzcA family heavy metal efflux RND transporter, partial [Gammaproteobacteria bacterium]|nr:CusA/CzcA family heavy metal efflux RND transporter [Gammaproteobacteria bacterium]